MRSFNSKMHQFWFNYCNSIWMESFDALQCCLLHFSHVKYIANSDWRNVSNYAKKIRKLKSIFLKNILIIRKTQKFAKRTPRSRIYPNSRSLFTNFWDFRIDKDVLKKIDFRFSKLIFVVLALENGLPIFRPLLHNVFLYILLSFYIKFTCPFFFNLWSHRDLFKIIFRDI